MRREGAGLQTKVQDGGKVRVKVLCSIGVLLLLDYASISTLEYVHVHNMDTLVRSSSRTTVVLARSRSMIPSYYSSY